MNKRLRKWGVFMESEEKNIYTEEKKVYTIEDIARELGVSRTTLWRMERMAKEKKDTT